MRYEYDDERARPRLSMGPYATRTLWLHWLVTEKESSCIVSKLSYERGGSMQQSHDRIRSDQGVIKADCTSKAKCQCTGGDRLTRASSVGRPDACRVAATFLPREQQLHCTNRLYQTEVHDGNMGVTSGRDLYGECERVLRKQGEAKSNWTARTKEKGSCCHPWASRPVRT